MLVCSGGLVFELFISGSQIIHYQRRLEEGIAELFNKSAVCQRRGNPLVWSRDIVALFFRICERGIIVFSPSQRTEFAPHSSVTSSFGLTD